MISRANLTRGRSTWGDDLNCFHVTGDSAEILTHAWNGVRFFTLNRPKTINSLTHSMVTTMHSLLRDWADDDDVHAVVVRGAGERGLCAGGDVVAIYHSIRTDGGSETRQFWHDEYVLNHFIARYPKPYIALMDGIVMGGGVGISVHAGTRVVTDTSKLAMPEVGIGLVPDVGGTYYLSRARRIKTDLDTGCPQLPNTSNKLDKLIKYTSQASFCSRKEDEE